MKVLKIIMVTLISCLFGLTLNVAAAQFDAPYYDLQEKNKDKWAAEDKQINAKLAALEKKFGKKPNIKTMSVGAKWDGKAAENTAVRQHRNWTRWRLRVCVSGAPTWNRLAHRPELPLTQAAIRCEPDCCLYSGQDRPTDFLARR